MIHEGEICYEQSDVAKKLLEKVVRERGADNVRIGRWALILDEVFVSTKTPKPRPPKKAKKPPPRSGGEVRPDDIEPEQSPAEAAQQRKPPHLQVCKWVKPPPCVQTHMKGAKLGKGQAQFLEIRQDLWVLMSPREQEAAIMTALLQRDIVDNEDGSFRVKRAELPVQTHPAVVAVYGEWWTDLDPESAA